MPFKRVTVKLEQLDALAYKGCFEPGQTFGARVRDNYDEKRLVAYYICAAFCKNGASVFVSDGSSTFFVCLGMALCSFEHKQKLTLLTNNLALATELEAQPFVPDKLVLKLLGGTVDLSLNATFPQEEVLRSRNWLKATKLIVTSVREFFWMEGPTSPDELSRALKHTLFCSPTEMVLALDWEKMSLEKPEPGTRVFDNDKAWKEVLGNPNREITIVSNRPPEATRETEAHGEELDSLGFTRLSPAKWRNGSPVERYSWQAYQFSLFQNVTFVEVDLPEP